MCLLSETRREEEEEEEEGGEGTSLIYTCLTCGEPGKRGKNTSTVVHHVQDKSREDPCDGIAYADGSFKHQETKLADLMVKVLK